MFIVYSAVLVFFALPAMAATFTMQTGYYVGDGTDNRVISGLGITPNVVFVKDDTNNGDDGIIMRTSAMAGDSSAKLAEAEANAADLVQALASGQFTIGAEADINAVDQMYYWTAFGGSDCTSTGTLCVGSYLGSGDLSRNVNVGFAPDLVIVKRAGATAGVWTSSAMPANTTAFFHGAASSAGIITALGATHFTVSANAAVNTLDSTYYFVAFKQVSGAMDVGTYTGNGNDNRNITSSDDAGLTFQPDFVWVKSSAATIAVLSQTEHYGDRTYTAGDISSLSNSIQELRSAGGFQVGNETTYNSVNTTGNTYYYAAFNGAVAKNPASETYTMKSGSYTGTGSGFSIGGIPFTPDLVIIKHNNQATDQYAVFRTSQMGGDNTLQFATAASFTGGITSLNASGFSVGTDARVNTSGDTYYWTAFGNATRPDKSGGANNFAVGAYIGTGVDGSSVTRLPIGPDLLVVKRSDSTNNGVWRTSSVAGDSSLFFHNAASAANYIQALTSDGFERGNNGSVNTGSGRYSYFAFAEGDDFVQNSYTGNGSTQNIAAYNWQPDMVWTKKGTGGTARGGLLRTSVVSGDASWPFLNQATLSNGFTNLLSDGFSLGSSVDANESGYTYYYAVWDGKKYGQSGFRFFENTDSTSVGTPLANANTSATLGAVGDTFRLRMLMHLTGGNLLQGNGGFILQYAQPSPFDTTCSGLMTWNDVDTDTAIAFYDNPSATDGAALTATSTDPTNGLYTIVNQNYLESQGSGFTNGIATIADIQDGKWDFSLVDYSASAKTTYCFRMRRADTVLFEDYTVPAVRITTGATGSHVPTVSNVSIDEGAPSITLTEGTTKNVQCTATATDTDGYSDITAVTAHLHQSSIDVSAPADDNHHYIVSGDSQCVPSSGSGNSEEYTCTFAVQYFANPTDAGSPNVLDEWVCSVFAYDGTSTSTVATDTTEIDSLIALSVDPESIDYSEGGPLLPEDIYVLVNKMDVVNTGNRDIDPQISGTLMTGDVHSGTIAVGEQKYENFAFDYATEGITLTTTPTTMDLALPQRTGGVVSDILHWGIQIPLGTIPDTYTGVNTLTAVPAI